MKIGKLRSEDLARLLSTIELDESVMVGPAIGEDAAVVRLGDKALVLTTDPITFATDLIGWYAVHISANDVAAMGAEPKWFMFTLIMDTGSTTAKVRKAFAQARQACKSLGVTLVGGHTETADGVEQPIAVGSMIGIADPDRVVRTSGAKPGDAIILAGYAAVEGTALLAHEAAGELAANGVRQETINRARDFLFDPGISAVAAARAAMRAGRPSAMHDPTEGGVATALLELATASGIGLRVDRERIKTLPETDEITRAVGIDPLGLVSSGSHLITTPAEAARDILAAIQAAGVFCGVIGEALPRQDGLTIVDDSGPATLPVFQRDEIARFLDTRNSC